MSSSPTTGQARTQATIGGDAGSAVLAAVRAGRVLVAADPADRHPSLAGWPVIAATCAVVVRAAPGRDPLRVAAELQGRRAARCYLDRIVLTAASDRACRHLVPGLYEVLGDAYEQLVDASRNVAAAEWIFDLLDQRLGGPPRTVLDIGCGTGLSMRARNRPLQLTGWDPSPLMRRLAADAGMPVLADLAEVAPGQWDAAIACYVLHLPGTGETVTRILPLLRPGGVLAANLHHSAEPGALAELSALPGVTCRRATAHPLHGDLIILSPTTEVGDR